MSIKKSVLTASVAFAALGMSASAMAFSNEGAGFVVGAQGGYADQHWSNVFTVPGITSPRDVKDTGFAARGYVGYAFNKYLGVETGYTYLPGTSVNFVPGVFSAKTRDFTVDLLAKLSVPVTNVFSLYAKAGGAYYNSRMSGTLSIPGEGSLSSSQTNTHIGPAFGVGAAYEVVPNLAIDLSWMRFSGQGRFESDNYQPNPDVVLLGVSYKFPVRYS